jgi:glutaminyl-peptide cyclotransferase
MKRILAGLVLLVLVCLIALPFLTHAQGKKNDEFAQEKKRDEFAADQLPKVGVGKPVAFDGKRAMRYLEAICDLGPRMSGTPAMKKQQALIRKHFTDLGFDVRAQNFDAKQISQKKSVPMTNLIVSFFPDRDRRIILSSHYDTRPIADQEENRRNWNKPFVSANDGASGVAMMMELGNHMKGLKSEVGVDFVLFDGEEYVFETAQFGGGDKYFFGSEHFAADYTKTRNTRKFKYEAGALLDLCHAKGTVLKVEQYSYAAAPKVCEQIWATAAGIGAKSFKYAPGPEVLDDHIALNRADIPTADLIDFDYPHWHRLTDTPDKISGEQMAEVAKVLATWWMGIK